MPLPGTSALAPGPAVEPPAERPADARHARDLDAALASGHGRAVALVHARRAAGEELLGGEGGRLARELRVRVDQAQV